MQGTCTYKYPLGFQKISHLNVFTSWLMMMMMKVKSGREVGGGGGGGLCLRMQHFMCKLKTFC